MKIGERVIVVRRVNNGQMGVRVAGLSLDERTRLKEELDVKFGGRKHPNGDTIIVTQTEHFVELELVIQNPTPPYPIDTVLSGLQEAVEELVYLVVG